MNQTIGISDIGLYLPGNAIGVEYVAAMRIREQPELAAHLSRALSTTGQVSMRFPRLWEDAATMAAEAARAVLLANPRLDLERLRHLTVGTETLHGDHPTGAVPLVALTKVEVVRRRRAVLRV